MKKAPMLFIDRRLAGKFWIQLLIIVGLFLCLMGLVAIVYTLSIDSNDSKRFVNKETFQKAFVDLTNPETLHNYVYDTTEYFHTKTANNDSRIKNTNKWPPLWAVFLAYIVGAIVFTGLLIATFTNAWRARADRFRRGAVSYKFRGHIVFLGYNNLVPGMIQKIIEKNNHARIVVGVENDASVICDKIKNRLFNKYRNNVVVLQADSCNMEDLERLRVPYADEVYIIGEHDDAYNLKCYRTIYELSLCENSKKARMPQCYVNLHSQATLTLFRTYASAGDLGIDFTKFHSFSFFDEWSKMITTKMIKENWAGKENYQDRFFIAGMTEMGIALARRIALLFHKPYGNNHTIISLIDDNAITKAKHFIVQHQVFFEHCQYSFLTKDGKQTHIPNIGHKPLDIEFEFIQGDLSDYDIREVISKSQQNSQQKTTIALCYDDSLLNLTMGLNLPEGNIRVWVYQPTLADLGKYLKNSIYKRVITFGMLGEHLDIRNNETTCFAMLINHYIRHQNDQQSINYSNKYLIKTEWNGIDISERWACIRRADFIPVLARYQIECKDDFEKMKDLEDTRTMVDDLLFPKKEEVKVPNMPKSDNSNYIKAIKQDIPRNIFVAQNKLKKRRND